MFTFDSLHTQDFIYLKSNRKTLREGYGKSGIKAMITKKVDSNHAYVVITEGTRKGYLTPKPIKIEQVDLVRTNRMYEAKGKPLTHILPKLNLSEKLDFSHKHHPMRILNENTISQNNIDVKIPNEKYESNIYAKFINEKSYVKIHEDKFNELVAFNDKKTYRFTNIQECFRFLNKHKFNFEEYTHDK